MKSLMEALWVKLLFWKQKKKTPEYKFENAPTGDSTWVEITSGKYFGVVYEYGTVKFTDEFNVPKLSFRYNIIDSGSFDLETLQSDQDFVTIMGDILTEIIMDNKNGPTRTDDTEEPDLL